MSGTPPGDDAHPGDRRTAAGFEQLYLSSRRRLLLQAYALTGDLDASRRAVREAFVAARHHWVRVSRLPRPEEWVRPRAWSMAQRRHVARLWHKEKGLSETERSVLDSLHALSDQQRKALLLHELAALDEAEIGQELGVPVSAVGDLVSRARSRYVELTGVAPDQVRPSIEQLDAVVASAALPRPPVVERQGRARRHLHTVTAVVGVLVVVLGGGWFATGTSEQAGLVTPAEGVEPITEAMLLQAPDLRLLDRLQPWREIATGDNTNGSGINSVCQSARFADPDGVAALVRRFRAEGHPRRTLVETVEVSGSADASAAAYETTLRWFAGCEEARLQLLNAYRLDGLGDEGRLLRLRIPGPTLRTYLVGVVRTGDLTVSTVVLTRDAAAPRAVAAAGVLTRAVRGLCESAASGSCRSRTKVVPMLPPPSGEEPGTLAVADLPAIAKVDSPWSGTDATAARLNLAATTCDKTSFVKAGAVHAISRTYLIPQEEKIPRRFGITETVGTFGKVGRARALVQDIRDDMAACEKKDLGAGVSHEIDQPRGYRRSEFALWRLDSEISEQKTVSFWMGVARVDTHVAQVTMTPTGDYDVDVETFRAMITRARDRLFELEKGGTGR